MPTTATNPIEIVLASYNGEKHLGAQIDSIFAQTYQNWHLLIGDDHSEDATLSILKELQRQYPDKISIYPSEQRLGLVQNFSRLLELTSAEYIMLCDQDDYWLPQKIEKSFIKIKELEKEWGKEVPLLVHTDMEIVDEDLKLIDKSQWKRQQFNPRRSGKLNAILMQNASWGCTMIINRNLIHLALPAPTEGFVHDYWLVLVASAFGQVGYVPEATMLYRQHEKNLVGSKNINFKWFINNVLKDPLYQPQMELRMMKHMVRAYVFYKRYQACLTEQQKEMIESFIDLKYQPLWKELYWRWKYDFFNHGFWPNLGLILATMRMGKAISKYRLRR